MSSLYGILSAVEVIHMIPTYIVIAFGAILAIAFIVGFAKGFRKVAWGGFYWLAAGVGFVFAYLYLAKANPYTKLFKGELAGMAGFAWTLTLAAGCILVAFILYGLFSAIFRPRAVYAKNKGYDEDEYDFELEDDEEDDTFYRDEETLIVKGGGKPKFFGRLAGAFMCVVNVAAVLAALTAIFVFVLDFTTLKDKLIGRIFDVPVARMALKYAREYTFDFLAIGLMMLIAYKGFKTGFLKTVHSLTSTIGILAVIVLCFVAPFTKFSSVGVINDLMGTCRNLYAKFKEPYEGIFTKLTAGLIMAVVMALAMAIVNFLLKKLASGVSEVGFFRVIDGFLALVLYLVIGAAVVGLLWSAMYLLDYCEVFFMNPALDENSVLATDFFEAVGKYLRDFADKNLLKFKK